MRTRLSRLSLAAACALATAHAGAQQVMPADGEQCAIDRPPAGAGSYVTPGGFVLVWPRNAGVTPGYTGCRTLWVMQSEQDTPLLMRLYFRAGKLEIVHSYDGRGGREVRSCTRPFTAPGCGGIEGHPFAALDLPTWPLVCTVQPDLPACARDPE